VRSWIALVAAVGVLTLAAGCTDRESGEATPGSSNTSTSTPDGTSSDAPSGSESPTVEIPPRPRDLSLDGLDPCTLFTDAQRAQLTVDDVRSKEASGDHYKGMRECDLEKATQEPFLTYSVIAATNEGVEFWLGGNRNADAKLISIGGYPAAQFSTKGVDTDCVVAVGVADGQHIQVEMTPWSGDFTQDDICQASEQAAEMALQTLQTLK